jgi:hypothetical protein
MPYKALSKEGIMDLMILIGVWSLAFGHITITNSLKFKARDARAFGLALILVAAYGLPHLNAMMGGFLPKFAASNEAFRSAYGLLIGALAVYVTGWSMSRVLPRLRIPSVNVSIKQHKKAA